MQVRGRRAGEVAALVVLIGFAVLIAVTDPAQSSASDSLALPPNSRWVDAPSGDGRSSRVLLLPGSGARPLVVLAASSAGITSADFVLAGALRARGMHVALACWFEQPEAARGPLACPNARPDAVVSEAHLADLDAAVDAAKRELGGQTTSVVVGGYSRGGGLAVLRAANGRPEPVVAIAPLLSGQLLRGDNTPDDVDIIGAGEPIAAPILVVHGTSDRVVAYSDSARFVNRVPNASLTSYDGVDHDIAWRKDLTGRLATEIANWVRARTGSQ
ncbi:MAG: alpha/beta hydrolase [Acidimicrobiia bacterium]